MNTKNRKTCIGAGVYWVLVFFVGYLLVMSGGGIGNGTGDGNGGSGFGGGGNGDGLAAAGDLEGEGSEDEETIAPNEGKIQDDEAENSQGGNDSPEEQSGEVSESPRDAAREAREAAAVERAMEKLMEAEEKEIIPSLHEKTVSKSQKTAPGPAAKVISAAEARKGFFGVKVSGRGRSLFLLDVSGSMDSPTSEGIARLQLLKNIFTAELDRLHRESSQEHLKTRVGSFSIVLFSDGVEYFPQNGAFLSYAFQRDITDAQKAIQSLGTRGGTNMLRAWQDIATSLKKNRCDMVYFLSDGEPSDCTAESLLDWLRNNLPGQKISTFSLGNESQLLKAIATQHGGTYRELR